MTRTIIISICFIFFYGQNGVAQTLPQYDNALLNGIYWNPSIISMDDDKYVSATYRHHYVGLGQEPKFVAFNFQTPIKFQNSSVGIALSSDFTGNINQTILSPNYSYNLKFSKVSPLKAKLGLGIDIVNLMIDGADHLIRDQLDQSIPTDRTSTIGMNIKLGGYFEYTPSTAVYSKSSKFYLGISATNILPSQVYFVSSDLDYYNVLHGFVLLGYEKSLGNNRLVFNYINSTAKLTILNHTLYAEYINNTDLKIGFGYNTAGRIIGGVGFTLNNYTGHEFEIYSKAFFDVNSVRNSSNLGFQITLSYAL